MSVAGGYERLMLRHGAAWYFPGTHVGSSMPHAGRRRGGPLSPIGTGVLRSDDCGRIGPVYDLGSSLDYGGSTESHAVNLAEPFAVSFWTRDSNDDVAHLEFLNSGNYMLRCYGSASYPFQWYVANASGGYYRAAASSLAGGGTVHHVLWTYDGSTTIRLFVDGVDRSSTLTLFGPNGSQLGATTITVFTVGRLTGADEPSDYSAHVAMFPGRRFGAGEARRFFRAGRSGIVCPNLDAA